MEWSGRLEEVSPSALAPRGRGQAWLNPPRKPAFSIKKSEFLLGKKYEKIANWWYLEWNWSWYFYWATHIDSEIFQKNWELYSPQLWPFVPGKWRWRAELSAIFVSRTSPIGTCDSRESTTGCAMLRAAACAGSGGQRWSRPRRGRGRGRLIFVLMFVKPPSVLSTYTHCIPKPLSTD